VERGLSRDPLFLHRQLLDAVGQAAVAMNLSGTVVYWNVAAEKLYGWTSAEAVGQPLGSLLPAGTDASNDTDLPASTDLLESADIVRTVLAGRSWTGETWVRRKDGTRVPVLVTDSPVIDSSGNVVGIIGVSADITDRLAAESALRGSQAQLLARFQHSSVAQVSTDLSRRVTAVNDAFCALFGGPPEAFVGQSVRVLLAPDPGDQLASSTMRVFAGEDEVGQFETTLHRLDGTPLPVLLHVTLQRDPAGEPTGVDCLFQDLTAQRSAEQGLHQREALMLALSANASDVALVIGLDGRVRYLTPSAAQILTVGVGDRVDMVDLSTVHPDDRADVRAQMASVLTVAGARVTMTYRSLDRSGQWRWVEQVTANSTDDRDIDGLVVNLRDVHERVTAERALVESEARYRLIAETAQEGIWTTDADGRTLYANQRMADLLGRPLADVYRYRNYELASPGNAATIAERTKRRDRLGAEQYEVVHRRPDGSELVLRASASPLVDDAGDRIGSLAMVSDVTDARRAEDRLRRQALHDELTGLPNRTLLLDRLDQEIERAQEVGGEIAVLLADVDQFKLVNDSLGHAAGDALLVVLGQRLCAHIRAGATVGRLGGDEFLVICPGLDERQAQGLAARLLAVMSEPVEIGGRMITVSASIGLAMTPGADAQTLIAQADAAMYEAKAHGRDRAALFDAVLAERAGRRLQMCHDLRRALAEDELSLHYQPVVDLTTNQVLGVEALCRWQHPDQGAIPPLEFVLAAEQSGLIATLDHWVIRRACRDAAAMRQSGVLPVDAYVAVNLSARNVGNESLEAVIGQAVRDAGLPFDVLVLEVTESAMMNDTDKARAQLERLRDRGARIAIDDFGTGHSSLAYLRKFPVSLLKMDRSFVTDISRDADNLAIVAAIVDMARALGLSTIAEGVETPADLATLSELGCRAGQGYLWSPAVPREQLGRVVDRLSVPAAPSWSAPQPRAAIDAPSSVDSLG